MDWQLIQTPRWEIVDVECNQYKIEITCNLQSNSVERQ